MSLYENCLAEVKKYDYELKDVENLAEDGLRFQTLGEYVDFSKDFLDDEDFNEYLDEMLAIHAEDNTEFSHFSNLSTDEIYKMAEQGWENYTQKWDKNIISPALEDFISRDEAFALTLVKDSIEMAYCSCMRDIAEAKALELEENLKSNNQNKTRKMK